MRREHPLALHRVLPVALLILLAAVAFLGVRGPSWYQRLYYPLRYSAEIQGAASRNRINPYLIAAIIHTESGFRAGTVSKAGAVGLMLVLPDTATELRQRRLVDTAVVSGRPLTDPAVNIEYGTAYVRYLVNRYHVVETALAAYNAGLTRADVWAAQGGDIRTKIAFPETQRYVAGVLRARASYERLYPHAFDGWDAKL
jgi:soluble lytic murein transglycosylase